MADTRLVVGIVGAPERAELAEQVGALVRHLGRAEPIDGITAGFFADRRQLVADLVNGLLPFHAGPLAVHELHRIFQAALAADQLAHRGALGAVRTAIDRRFPARLLADPHAVGDFRRDGAADRAVRADTLANGCARGERPG